MGIRGTVLALAVAGAVALGALVAGDVRAPGVGEGGTRSDEAPWTPPRGALFGTPVEDPLDHRILRVLLDNIEHTPAGETIRIVGFSLTVGEVADALVDAHRRGVDVRVVLNGHTRRYGASRALAGGLGGDTGRRSFVVFTRHGARGDDRFGVTHQKSWSFSRTGTARYVSMIGSMNLSYASTRQYTDVYSYVGRRDVWRALGSVFADQVRDRPVDEPGVTRRIGRDTLHFFPGFPPVQDPVLRTLLEVPARDTTIRVSMLAWHSERGLRLAQVLAEKSRAGAEVRVVQGPYFGSGVLDVLRDAGVEVVNGTFDEEADEYVHHKLLLADWTDEDGRRQRLVSTGSDNWGMRSLYNDDLVLMIDADRRPRLYRRYVDHFERIRSRGLG